MYQTLTADSQRQKTKNTCGKILGNIGLFLLVFLAAVPVLWLIYLSLKSNTDILTKRKRETAQISELRTDSQKYRSWISRV